ncbi:hypothetical protein ACRAWF_31810 [Streptomyces sp. L7]
MHRPRSFDPTTPDGPADRAQEFVLTGELPTGHPLFNDGPGRFHDPQAAMAMLRQVGEGIGPGHFGIPPDRVAVFYRFGLEVADVGAWRRQPGPGTLVVTMRVRPDKVISGAPRALEFDTRLEIDGAAAGTGSASLLFLAPVLHRSHREHGRATALAAAGPDTGRSTAPSAAGPEPGVKWGGPTRRTCAAGAGRGRRRPAVRGGAPSAGLACGPGPAGRCARPGTAARSAAPGVPAGRPPAARPGPPAQHAGGTAHPLPRLRRTRSAAALRRGGRGERAGRPGTAAAPADADADPGGPGGDRGDGVSRRDLVTTPATRRPVPPGWPRPPRRRASW